MTALDEPDPFADLKPHIEALDALFSYLDRKSAPSIRKACGSYARSNSRPCQTPPRPNSRCRSHEAKGTGSRTAQGKAQASRLHWAAHRSAERRP